MTKTITGRIVGIAVVSWGSLLFGADHAATEEPRELTQVAYGVTGGTAELHFDASMLDALGWTIVSKASEAQNDLEDGIALPINKGSTFQLDTAGGVFDGIIGGSITTFGALLIEDTDNASRIVLGNFGIGVDKSGRWSVTSKTGGADEFVAFEVPSQMIDFTTNTARLHLAGELIIAEGLAQQIGRPELASIEVGVVRIFADMAPANQVEGPPRPDNPPAQSSRGTSSGPDVIVGDLPDTGNYGSSGDIAAFSVGTTSCNIGDENLQWIEETNRHPVIGQNMYKLQGGRLTCIGQSWLKHGFFALSGTLCSDGGGCDGDPSGNNLGPGCSDPYTAGLNGIQSLLGPRSQVNPFSGIYPYPFSAPPAPATIGRRLQVHHADLEPSLNPDAQYFVEGHYISFDDAQEGNALNNASYRPIDVNGGGTNFGISLTGETQREQPAIQAWADFDPDVTVASWPVLGEGLYFLATKITDKGDGWFLYDYAVQNLNSDRAGSAFSVRVFPGTPLRNIGFHDVDSHSGEPYELTDWEVVQGGGLLTWQTDDCQTNPDTNALRWGTMYNFWFEARKEPQVQQGAVQLRLCKTGNPESIVKRTAAPVFTSTDCNKNGVPDDEDISSGTSEDCTGNFVPDECEGDDDGDGIWNPCDICDLGDNTLDEDGDGVPDACDACPGIDDNPDFDADGVPNCLDQCPNTGPGVPVDFCGCNDEPGGCRPAAPPFPHNRLKNRYISFAPNLPGLVVKLRVSLSDSLPHPGLIGASWWVQEPITPVPGQFPRPALGAGECVALLGPEATAAWIDWDAAGCQVLHVTGCPIEPTSEYVVQAEAGANASSPLTVTTILKPGAKWWCDTVGIFNGTEWTPAQGVTNIDDGVVAIMTWQGGPVVPPGPIPPGTMAHLSVGDVEPGTTNTVVNFADVQRIFLAFQGQMYPFGPADADGNCP